MQPIDGDLDIEPATDKLCNSTWKRLTLLTTGGHAANSTSSHRGDGVVATAAATRAAAQFGHVLDAASSTSGPSDVIKLALESRSTALRNLA